MLLPMLESFSLVAYLRSRSEKELAGLRASKATASKLSVFKRLEKAVMEEEQKMGVRWPVSLPNFDTCLLD